ncbi:hypothetical protein DFR79_13017 [Halanaerobium saccharolyticum]|uniref:DUF5320 domain-containing protein n=1 Tax=Halanaerobium saccharolyticum TaxID=43595 RepID=A0A4V3CDQ9_9FIRM|nr:DUF5320 domain-containing protein [Halanaerobium saccharolyticum]TDO78275.1 hypothetical protein DFR79_13017 [Halanaerobium saccharolyticum]
MPRGNRRGPEGACQMTGRGLGYCAGNDQPGFTADTAPQRAGRGFRNGSGQGPRFGRGQGRGRGIGHARAAVGRGRGAYHQPAENEAEDLNSPESRNREITRLENLANTLSSELEIVKNKIDELKNN